MADGDTDPTEAAFLDQVIYTPANLPVITLNPFQPNQLSRLPSMAGCLRHQHPRRHLAMVQGWFRRNCRCHYQLLYSNQFRHGRRGGQLLCGCEQSFRFSRYAQAAVTFVSAPLPPAWSTAFKSPFANGYNQFEDFYVTCIPDSQGTFMLREIHRHPI